MHNFHFEEIIEMKETVERWLYDPVVGKMVAILLGIVFISILVRLSQRLVGRYVKESDTRYRVRKFVTILGYSVGLIMIIGVVSKQLEQLYVAFGVAGAGITFALQEVIASIAGWFAISFSNFYRTGDRVQLGGIKEDVIDVGVLFARR